nr:glycoside hydrolase family 108 protein [Methylobacterium sp. OTU13CASTA1]
MSAERYQDAINRVLVHEGGYVNDPRDPGGATMKGVTQRTFDGYLKRTGKSSRPVRSITPAEIATIYKKQYWDAIRGDELPEGVDYVLFDGAVNSGPVQSVKWLQRALGVRVDGVIGEATVAAAEAYPDHDALVAAILSRRLAFLQALSTWKAFGKGWGRRVSEVKAIGQAWATGSVGPQPTYVAGIERRGLLSDARSVPGKGFADATTGGGIVTGAISQVTDTLQPLSGTLPSVSTALTVLTVVGAVLAAAGIAYRLWAKGREKDLDDALDRTPVAADPANDNAADAAEQKEAA